MYGKELAFIHDKYFGQYARRTAKDILPVIKKRVPKGETILDLGCGSGILSEILLDAGYAVYGIDISPNMIRLARQRVPEATFRVGSIWSDRFPFSACVVSIGETINYIKAGTRPSLVRLFRRVGVALKPDGLFIFDTIVRLLPARKTFEAGRWALDVTTDINRDRVRRQIDISIKHGSSRKRVAREIHHQRTVKETELRRVLRDAGFNIRSVLDAPLPGRRIFICNKI